MAKAKPETPKDAKTSKQSTLASFFGAPKPGPRPASTNPSSSPALNNGIRRPSSATAGPASSPVVRTTQGKDLLGKSSPLGGNKKNNFIESEDELTPPPESGPSSSGKKAVIPEEDEDVQMLEDEKEAVAADGSPIKTGRRVKRKVMYVESDSDGSEEDVVPKGRSGRKPRKSLKADSDAEDFVFDDADDAAMAAAAEEYEASIVSRSPSAFSASPEPIKKKAAPKRGFVAPKSAPKKDTTSWYDGNSSARGSSPPPEASSSRPGPRPLPSTTYNSDSQVNNAGASARSNDSNSLFLTKAERSKLEAKEQRREAEQCFDFLVNVKDKDGHSPDHPDYDKRTIAIPKQRFNDKKGPNSFTPFEKQFWEIKQNHYDTILFFQKGKFYELYEDDALVGHQEFDLKLTDRVKMKMVGVPEQSLEYWIQKFLGAGHKVGVVEQAETAIGMQMRNKKDASSGNKGKEPAIVNRELRQVFTNGTIVDGTYLSSDDANHCVVIKEFVSEIDGTSAFGVCILDASTGHFDLSAFEDDILRTRLETMFRQIRPKELVHSKGNLSVNTTRMLRNILPSATQWQSFEEGKEFCSANEALAQLSEFFAVDEDQLSAGKAPLPDAIRHYQDNRLAMEALGGMLFYLRSLQLDKDLVSQSNFDIYDPMKEGQNLILDGQTLAHMEVLVNDDGGTEGTLYELLQRCITPFGKRLFHLWLTMPLRDADAIDSRLDAVDDIMNDNTAFSREFTNLCKGIPDLERLISRIHAGSERESKFLDVIGNFQKLQSGVEKLRSLAENFKSPSVGGLLRTIPDLSNHLEHIQSMYEEYRDGKTVAILPRPGADEECDAADAAVQDIDGRLNAYLKEAKRITGLSHGEIKYWHSSLGLKEIYHIEVPARTKVPSNWSKQSSTKAVDRYCTPQTIPLIREIQEAKETANATKKDFYKRLLGEFDKDRKVWLKAVRVIAELDCLVSLAKASGDMDEPKCRPEFIESSLAFIDFEELRHPSMCLRSDFISNNVQLGYTQARQVLLTGPNMAGKSTLLRMTAAGVIMAQLGCYVPASKAKMSPVDRIQTRMGAYDNMFASASTFKVELDECAKILRDAGPKSLVILDELGRGTSTYDGMAIAGAVLHHLATHTLPLGFFATHYGSLTDDFTYHPNIRKMHMQTHVDDELKQVVFLYKLIPGVAESSHGTHVAQMAGVPMEVVLRAQSVSDQFFADFNKKLNVKRQSSLPLMGQSDFSFLMKLFNGLSNHIKNDNQGKFAASIGDQMDVIRECIGRYEMS
ncbi:uncharacterized protein L201_000429 [Kwoniella dendrophila CBS 6074]|uniref:DNA mismatch repair protein n=1 Tax=Kwoniella dendrophila CBS 6074 TaxID=1295534 RepID=A0AAX4JLY4_9TREE